ncbi:hypothetical protein D3C81_1998360 [compost metagenome]
MDHAVAVGVCVVHAVVARGQRYVVAVVGIGGFDDCWVGADAGVDSRVVGFCTDGDSECGVCRVGG